MKTKFKDYEVLVPNLDGTEVAERVNVKIPLEWDEELEVWVLTPEAHRIIEDTKARHMGLLLPVEFKELRERFKLSQKEMGELFQAGEKSWTRWETGKQRPSRMVSLLVRSLYEGEISINYLLKKAGKPMTEVSSAQSPFSNIDLMAPKKKTLHNLCSFKGSVSAHLGPKSVSFLAQMKQGNPEFLQELGSLPAGRNRICGPRPPTHQYTQPTLQEAA